mmetsp:Transcript_58742/g.137104  ORF Transcript_58742/g.137104 Transcript_58742/m.137104 type:complete len:265 (+) Transcript_58742:66-860(+)
MLSDEPNNADLLLPHEELYCHLLTRLALDTPLVGQPCTRAKNGSRLLRAIIFSRTHYLVRFTVLQKSELCGACALNHCSEGVRASEWPRRHNVLCPTIEVASDHECVIGAIICKLLRRRLVQDKTQSTGAFVVLRGEVDLILVSRSGIARVSRFPIIRVCTHRNNFWRAKRSELLEHQTAHICLISDCASPEDGMAVGSTEPQGGDLAMGAREREACCLCHVACVEGFMLKVWVQDRQLQSRSTPPITHLQHTLHHTCHGCTTF